MSKYLHITEYSSLIPYKIPNKKENEHEFEFDGSVFRSFIDSHKEPIKESYGYYLPNEAELEEKTIPLDDIVIYDVLDLNNEDQKVAYIYECPVCLEKTITTTPILEFCPHCENAKFSPQVIGLINIAQMEEIAIDNADTCYYVQVKDNEVIVKEEPEKEKESIFK